MEENSWVVIDPQIDEILMKSKQTKFFGIYENKKPKIDKSKPNLVIIIGPTGTGKSTFIKYLEENGFTRAITATTRKERKIDDHHEAYVWLEDKMEKTESLKRFEQRIADKYKLLETNIFAENIYGTPKSSIEIALHQGKGVIGVDNHGAEELKKKLEKEANIIIFFVLPDNYEELRKRIVTTRNDYEKRLKIAKEEIKNSGKLINYYIHNTVIPIYSKPDESPLEHSKKNLLSFINDLIG